MQPGIRRAEVLNLLKIERDNYKQASKRWGVREVKNLMAVQKDE